MTTPDPAFLIVGRVRKAHGIRGEVVVELLTDEPDAIFASGRRVFAGNTSGDLAPDPQELHISSVRPFNEGLLLSFAEVPDRNAAELWRARYLLVPASEVPAPDDDEVYLHDLIGLRVDLEDGATVGMVEEVYELPLGLAVEVRRLPPRQEEMVLLPWDHRTIASVDRAARVIVVTPPDGLLE